MHDKQALRPLVILGAGGHAVSVANVASSAGYTIKCFVDKNQKGSSLIGIGIIDIAELDDVSRYAFAIAIGDNAVRERISNELKSRYERIYFPALVHSSAEISILATVGEGTVVMPKAVVGPNSSVGKFCILNTQSSIDHDCTMQDFSSLAPGSITGGKVSLGMRSAISIGAIVKHAVAIGNDCVLGANSYLNKNLADNVVAYGTPAKVIRSRKAGDEYL